MPALRVMTDMGSGATFDRGRDAARLEQKLGYRFSDPGLLDEALTHPSCGTGSNYERLEFLGDAVLELTISEILFGTFPDAHEGDLTRQRASLVQTSSLASVAQRIDLGSYLNVGLSEVATSGRQKPTILENALEAVLGAVYLDGGLEAAQRVVSGLFTELLRTAPDNRLGGKDSKTELQEKIQAGPRLSIEYVIDGSDGPPHNPTFHVVLYVGGKRVAEGTGSSKKRAEQRAAQSALADFENVVARAAE